MAGELWDLVGSELGEGRELREGSDLREGRELKQEGELAAAPCLHLWVHQVLKQFSYT